ncbi:hypothetical protein [Viridibacillus arvi]|uniref:hypothetical protein n=1 Tax=Viridibacillus arvi TaxID=263475 RepID=UPI003CFC1FD2
MARKHYVYALYKGENYLIDGTLDEIAEARGVSRETILFYGTPTHQKRIKNVNKCLLLVKLED